MSSRWIRTPPDDADTARALVVAGAAAAVVGLVTFYLARLLATRDELSTAGPPGKARDSEAVGGGA